MGLGAHFPDPRFIIQYLISLLLQSHAARFKALLKVSQKCQMPLDKMNKAKK